jgi:hypothetical protein
MGRRCRSGMLQILNLPSYILSVAIVADNGREEIPANNPGNNIILFNAVHQNFDAYVIADFNHLGAFQIVAVGTDDMYHSLRLCLSLFNF